MPSLITQRYTETTLGSLIPIAVASGAQINAIDRGNLGHALVALELRENVQIAEQLHDQVQMIESLWELMGARYRDVADHGGHARHRSIVLIVDDPDALVRAADPPQKTPPTATAWWRPLIRATTKQKEPQQDSLHAKLGALTRLGCGVDIRVNAVLPTPDTGSLTTQCKNDLMRVQWARPTGCDAELTDERQQS